MNDILKIVNSSMEESLVDDRLNDLCIDMTEDVIDTVIQNDALRDIPILGTIIGLIKTSNNVNNYYLCKKIISFLGPVGKIDSKKRADMIHKINSNPKYKIKIGECLISIINKCDDHIKAKCAGQLFVAQLEQRISYEDFMRASFAINAISLIDLQEFLNIPQNIDLNGVDCHIYSSAGLTLRADINEYIKHVGANPPACIVGTLYNFYSKTGQLVREIIDINN